MSLDSLDGRLRRVASRLERGVERFVGSVVAEIGKELVPATPVDTGLARGNWRPSLNGPASTPIAFLDLTGAATVARIQSIGRQYRLGQTVYIVNRVPYISMLNSGSSPQAPAGFVQASVRRAVSRASARQRGLL